MSINHKYKSLFSRYPKVGNHYHILDCFKSWFHYYLSALLSLQLRKERRVAFWIRGFLHCGIPEVHGAVLCGIWMIFLCIIYNTIKGIVKYSKSWLCRCLRGHVKVLLPAVIIGKSWRKPSDSLKCFIISDDLIISQIQICYFYWLCH